MSERGARGACIIRVLTVTCITFPAAACARETNQNMAPWRGDVSTSNKEQTVNDFREGFLRALEAVNLDVPDRTRCNKRRGRRGCRRKPIYVQKVRLGPRVIDAAASETHAPVERGERRVPLVCLPVGHHTPVVILVENCRGHRQEVERVFFLIAHRRRGTTPRCAAPP